MPTAPPSPAVAGPDPAAPTPDPAPAPDATSAPRPLAGLVVLDLSRLLPGPFASLLLADLGAEVIKIEAPEGGDYARWYPPLVGGHSAAFGALNRNKQSVVIDLKRPEGVAALRSLAARADVLLESFRPGVMDRLGVGWPALRALNPRLIYCAISGFGQDGPLATRAGHDLGYLALAGLLGVGGLAAQAQAAGPADPGAQVGSQADPGAQVVPPGFQAADLAGGSLYAVVGILAALLSRGVTGRGQLVDVSMTDGVAGLGVMLQANQAAGAAVQAPGSDLLAGGRPGYGVYRCADGRWLAVGALEPKFFAGFCAAIGLPELARDGLATGARGVQIRVRLAAHLAGRDRDAWVAALAGHDVCVEPVLDLEEARLSPLAQARGWFEPAAEGLPPHHRPNPRLLPAHPPPAAVPAPALGADTEAVLRRFGVSEADLATWRAAGGVGLPPR